ncbi:MAG TPA: hypothetical protein VN861_08540 [Candidatus Acidoferrales bacterium]|nr:hypothetical protein [Candidatus Acidoferrales bacterium]
MSPSSPQNIGQKNPCPDSELLAAFSENRVDGFVLGAVAAHLIQCPECAELHHRLLNLAKADLHADTPEWRDAERRLDDWMEKYLRARPGQPEAEPQIKQIISTANAGARSKSHPWRVRWALSAAAALALVAATIFFLNRNSLSRHPEVASETAPTSSAPASSASPHDTDEPVPANSLTFEAAQPEKETPPKTNPAAKPKSHPAPAHLASSNQTAVSHAKPAQPPRDAMNSTAAASVSAASDTAAHTNASHDRSAVASTAPPSSHDFSSPAASSHPAAIASQPANTSKVSLPAAKSTKAAPPASLPALISLEYSTSLWIQLTSDDLPEDGTFHFRGTLLKPVELPVGVPFDTDTRVDGLGGVNEGRISLLIKEFFFQGARYKLKSGNGSARVEPFNGRRTLEIWLDEDSVYERVADNSTPAARRTGSAAFRERSTSAPARPPSQ